MAGSDVQPVVVLDRGGRVARTPRIDPAPATARQWLRDTPRNTRQAMRWAGRLLAPLAIVWLVSLVLLLAWRPSAVLLTLHGIGFVIAVRVIDGRCARYE